MLLTLVASIAIAAEPGTAVASEPAVEAAVDQLKSGLGSRVSPGDLIAVSGLKDLAGCPSSAELTAAIVAALQKHQLRSRTQTSTQQAINETARAMQQGKALEDAPLEGSSLGLHPAFELRDGSCVLMLAVHDIGSGQLLSRSRANVGPAPVDKAALPSLDIALRRLSDRLAAGLAKLDGNERYQRFGVLSFDEVGESTKDKELGKIVAAELQTWLRRDHNLLLLEREQLGRLIEEIQLGQTGLIKEEQAVEVGQMSGADALVLGSVLEAGDRYVVNAKLVSSASGQVVGAERVELPAADLIALSSDAVVLRSRSGAVFRSLLIPGWGQFYNREPIKGSLLFGTELIAGGLAAAFHVMQEQSKTDYDNLGVDSPLDTFKTTRDAIESQQRWRQTFVTTALILHAINIVDAYLTAESFDSAQSGLSADGFGLSYRW
ncbi:MAG: FlgO family outer membrane protein [Myxococcota bacterium]|nr:FlgO family outer membrane protein [Myxococcota bacterium]